MALTKEQLALRKTGIGASEVAALVDLDPRRTALDVWCSKVLPTIEEEQSPQAEVGDFLEPALRSLFTRRTGIEVMKPPTLQHPEIEWAFASPDGLSLDGKSGLELKAVGKWMAPDWDAGPPDYVITQAAWNLFVSGRERWHIGALIGGTSFDCYVVERDEELIEALREVAELFWIAHVLTEVPPEPRDAEDRRRMAARRHAARSTGLTLRRDEPEIATMVQWLSTAREMRRRLEAAEQQLEAGLIDALNGADAIEGAWGSFSFREQDGRVGWKDVALELAGGAVSVDVLERHRGAPYRTARLAPFKSNSGQRRSEHDSLWPGPTGRDKATLLRRPI